ncbi:MAG: hypothetical protein ACLFUJ_03250 [Phycisphaerae bacterium]
MIHLSRRNVQTAMFAAAMTMLAVSSGCSTAIKEGVGLVQGPKGLAAEIEPVASTEGARPLGEYTQFRIGEISDPYHQLPAGFIDLVKQKFTQRLADSDLPLGRPGKTLELTGVVLYFEMSSMIGKAFGPLEEVIIRTDMVDASSGQVLGKATCIGRTTNRVNLGVEKKADGLAKAFVDWIVANHPAGASQ